MIAAAEPRGVAAQWQAAWQALRNTPRRRKAASLGIALALEALILLLLLTLGTQFAGDEKSEVVTTMTAIEFAAPPELEQAEEPASDSAAAPDTPTPPVTEQPLDPEPLRPSPLALNPKPAAEPVQPRQQPAQEPQPQASPSAKIGARIRPGRTMGPADTGNPRNAGDSERVGTAPNGEPLYAARWYREPTQQELAGYLSTANGPGVALIACRTVPDYYVDDCVLESESPPGSMMGRAVLAAAWQFRVRPARVGGREQVGSWVRIRITYSASKARR